jgi:tetratricopeptide (TPR) repeat protein
MPEQPSSDTAAQEPAHDLLERGLAVAFGPNLGSTVAAPGTREDDHPTPKPPGLEAVGAPEQVGRYRLLGEVARGGMGAVLRGRDVELGRELAVKVLLEVHQDNAAMVQRFVEEAQIGSQLQHPGIAPVHDLGRLTDGRPFFTMKLVEGRTLADLLKERPAPSHDRPRFLTVFEQVCQTVAYAHARGVIHRDLKPANVMVGAFGEVQVMDWGLAKVLDKACGGCQPPENENECGAVRTVRTDAPGHESQAGVVLGTLAYAAPEQARGHVDRLDERCDVFGLGAILCEILTGKPPYVGEANRQLYQTAARADLADAIARLDHCGADEKLVRLCKECLAPEPGDRPRDAGAVARRVTAYLTSVQDRLRAAEVERAAALTKAAEAHKRQRLTVALAAAVLLLVIAGGGGWWWIQKERADHAAERARQKEEKERAVEKALAEVDRLRRQGKWREAQAALQRSIELVPGDSSAGSGDSPWEVELKIPPSHVGSIRTTLGSLQADLEMAAKLEEIRLGHADRMKDGHFDFAGADRAFRAAFKAYGLDVMNHDVETAADRIGASLIKEELVAALDDWARDKLPNDPEGMKHLLAIARTADPDKWRDRFRDPALQGDRQALEELVRDTKVADLPPATAALLADALARAGSVETAVDVLKQAQRRHPNDFWLNHELGFYLHQSDAAEAAGFYRAALALRPDSPGVHYNLGNALLRQNKLDEAEAEYRRAISLQKDYVLPYNNLGVVLLRKGKKEDAIAQFRQALEVQPDHLASLNNLADVLKELGRPDEALPFLEKITRQRPKDAAAFADLGQAHHQLGHLTEAVAAFRKAVELRPYEAAYQSNLGLALTDAGDHDGAIKALDEALRLQPDDAVAYKNRGLAYQRKGNLTAAQADYEKALSIRPNDSQAYSNLGGLFLSLRSPRRAAEACEKAIAIEPKNADAHHNLGLARFELGKYAAAAESFRQALALRPLAGTYFHLALALERLGRLEEAEAAYRDSLKLQPDNAQTHYNRGVLLQALERETEAEKAYRRAVELDPKLEVAHCNLALALERQEKYAEAADAYRRATDLDPEDALAHYGLGRVLKRQGRLTEALKSMRQAHKLGSRDPSWDHPTDQEVRNLERLVELDGKLSAVRRGEAQPADALERINLALLCGEDFKQLYATAARFYAEAFAHDPKLADDLRNQHRYNAACAAALAGCGQGKDADKLDDKERARLRKQALDWLRADLAHWTEQAASDKPNDRERMRKTLKHWQADPDLAGIRAQGAVAKLPADEREACQKLWADVDALLRKANDME